MQFKWRYVLSIGGTVIGLAIAAVILMPEQSEMALSQEREDAMELVQEELDTAHAQYLDSASNTLSELESQVRVLRDETKTVSSQDAREYRKRIETARKELTELKQKSGQEWVRLRREIVDDITGLQLAIDQDAFRSEQLPWLQDAREELDSLEPDARPAAKDDIEAVREMLARFEELLNHPRFDEWKDWQGQRYLLAHVRDQAETQLARVERRVRGREVRPDEAA